MRVEKERVGVASRERERESREGVREEKERVEKGASGERVSREREREIDRVEKECE